MKNEIVSDEVAYTGAICAVHKVVQQNADGRRRQRDKVVMSDAAVIVPVLADGSVVLIRNERFTINEQLWEFPAGKIDGQEKPEACAARELIEETGYRAGKLVRLGGFYTCPGLATEYIHAFLATDLTAGPQELEGYEAIEVHKVPLARLREMMEGGTLHDAKSLAAFALWQLREGR